MSDFEETTNPSQLVDTLRRDQRDSVPTADTACLVVIYGDELGRRITINRACAVIGRSSGCDVQFDQESVSRKHCEIVHEDGQYFIIDSGSTNGTYVNDELAEERMLRDGDQLKIGRNIVKFIRGDNVESQYHEEIYRMMTTDGLTSLHNKRYFEEALDREISRAMRYGRTFSLILFDIDHFKKINDGLGHLAGDAVLRQLGAVVNIHVRRDDVVSRIGGEEFAIITPENGRQSAFDLARKLNGLIADTPFEFEGSRIQVSVSLGVAEWKPTFASGTDILGAADAKLYEAKRLGRNRACA